MTTPLNVEETRVQRMAARNEHKRELVLKANPELRARELADKYGLDPDDVLMRLRERFLAVVEDAEVAIQTDRLTNLDDQSKTELREWLRINEDARAIAAKWGLDSARVLTVLIRTSGTGMFCFGPCLNKDGASVSYSPCLRTALERAHQLGLFTPLEVLQYFEDYMSQTRFPPLEVEYDPTIFSVIALLTGQLDGILARC